MTALSDEGAPILIQGAMDMEVSVLVEALAPLSAQVAGAVRGGCVGGGCVGGGCVGGEGRDSPLEPIKIGPWVFWKGCIDQIPVIISLTNIGLAHAAAVTTLAIERFKPRLIINQGTAGGHDPSLRRGDIVIGERVVNIGELRTQQTPIGDGVHPNRWLPASFNTQVEESAEGEGGKGLITYLESDSGLVEKALSLNEAFQTNNVSHTSGKSQQGRLVKRRVVKGTIGSADQWNRELDRINWLHQTYGTSVEEMETSAVALVAKAYDIPFLGVRIISNTDQHGEEFDPQTAEECQNFIIRLIQSGV